MHMSYELRTSYFDTLSYKLYTLYNTRNIKGVCKCKNLILFLFSLSLSLLDHSILLSCYCFKLLKENISFEFPFKINCAVAGTLSAEP